MNSAQDPNSSQPAETARILFLCSRQLDGDLTSEESSELAVLQQTDAHRACLAAMTNLRGHLKALPVRPVSASFATSVHDAIHQESMTVSAASAPNTLPGRILRGIVAVSVTACAAALILFLRSQDVAPSNRSAEVALAEGSDDAAERKSLAIPATEEAPEAKSSALEAGPAADAVAEQNEIAREEELRPFLENDQWRIVVVKVHSKDPDEVMQIITKHVAKGGMDIRSVVGKTEDDHDARFGVLFTSTGESDIAFIDNVISETEALSADWNPQSVADSSNDSFIHRLQESMKSPTLSELHFGQVYMALLKTKKSPAAASDAPMAQNDAVNGAAPQSAASRTTAPSPNGNAAVPSGPSARKTPVLVVFEFADKAPERI